MVFYAWCEGGMRNHVADWPEVSTTRLACNASIKYNPDIPNRSVLRKKPGLHGNPAN